MTDTKPKQEQPNQGMERYLAYLGRLARLKRYLAYASDVGQSLRPVTNKIVVTSSYMLSWGYVLYDCHSHAKHAQQQAKQGKNYRYYRTFTKEFVFQAMASMLIPSIIIHTVVKQSASIINGKDLFKGLGNKRNYVPAALGLSLIPLFPFTLDHPVQSLVDYVEKRIPDKYA